MEKERKKKIRPEQKQRRPGLEDSMKPIPETAPLRYSAVGKLKDKIALITGGDSGIGKAVALLFAREGAHIAIAYLNETKEAKQTQKLVKDYGVNCLIIKGDLSKEKNCQKVITKIIKEFGGIDIVVNNAGLHWECDSIEKISSKQLVKTFENNFFSYFWIAKYALPYLKKGSTIINTSSVTAYRGSPNLLDYSATKGAIICYTRSLSLQLIDKGIRVNAVGPGPIWNSFDCLIF